WQMNKEVAFKQLDEDGAITRINKEAAITRKRTLTLLDPVLLKPALWGAFVKLNPAVQWRNPVMFVVYIGSIVTTLLWLQARNDPTAGFILSVSEWPWST